MEQRKFASKKRYVAAIIIGTLAFLLVFTVSYSLSYLELQRVSSLQTGIGYGIFEDKLDYSFFNMSICDTGSFDKISQDLGFQGRIIDDLERKLGKQDEGVLVRKKFYSLIEIEHLEFVKTINLKCGKEIDTILFFYSNKESEISASEETGRILGVLFSRNEDLMIYSFDVDLASELVNKLEKKYNITNSPVIVINEKTKIEMPVNINEIEKYLN